MKPGIYFAANSLSEVNGCLDERYGIEKVIDTKNYLDGRS